MGGSGELGCDTCWNQTGGLGRSVELGCGAGNQVWELGWQWGTEVAVENWGTHPPSGAAAGTPVVLYPSLYHCA